MLRKECENAMRTLSTGSEAMIDIDSLAEGVDYNGKISKPRFEDLGSIPFIHLKKAVAGLLESQGLRLNLFPKWLWRGGSAACPRR